MSDVTVTASERSPVGEGAPPEHNSFQFYGRDDGTSEIEFWFAGKPQRIAVESLSPVSTTIGVAVRTYIDPLNCAYAVEAFLQVLVDHGWVLSPPNDHN